MSSPLACDLTAIAPEQRASHQALTERLMFELVQEIRELSDGYAFRFMADDYPALMAYVANERLCCPFFTFVIEVSAERGPIWLRLTGREGVKEFLRVELHRF
jgi:hypothetical protein